MRLGKTLPTQRIATEVMYHGEKDRTSSAVVGTIGERVPLPYSVWSLEAMDAHGAGFCSGSGPVRLRV
jgi:hypothetical protein